MERLRIGKNIVISNRFHACITKGAMSFLHCFFGKLKLNFWDNYLFNLEKVTFTAVYAVLIDMQFSDEIPMKVSVNHYSIFKSRMDDLTPHLAPSQSIFLYLGIIL